MRPVLTLGLSLLVVLVVVTLGGEGVLVVLLLSFVLLGYLLWDLGRSKRATRASVGEAVARLNRMLTRE